VRGLIPKRSKSEESKTDSENSQQETSRNSGKKKAGICLSKNKSKYDKDMNTCSSFSVKGILSRGSMKMKKIVSSKKVTAGANPRGKGNRIKWTREELSILRNEFSKFFHLKKAPDEESVKMAISRHSMLRKRTVAQIKSRALYLIQTGR